MYTDAKTTIQYMYEHTDVVTDADKLSSLFRDLFLSALLYLSDTLEFDSEAAQLVTDILDITPPVYIEASKKRFSDDA